MDTLTQAVINALRMIDGFPHGSDQDYIAYEALLEEIHDELMRGLGEIVELNDEFGPTIRRKIDDFLKSQKLEGEE